MIRIWRGFHSSDLLESVKTAWEKEELLILCPPGLRDLGFLELLPESPVEFLGDWSEFDLENVAARKFTNSVFRETPVLGVFTSGTVSGAPRLVLYSKTNVRASLDGIRSFFDVSSFDTLFSYPQPFHTFGLVLGYVQAVLYGLQFVSVEGKYSREFHQKRLSLSSSAVLTLGTPTHFYDLLAYAREQKITPCPTYSCIMGGAKVSRALWLSVRDDLKIKAPSIGYGSTEACPGVTHQSPGRIPLEEGEIGTAIPNVKITLLPRTGLEFEGPNVCLAVIQDGKISFPEKIHLNDNVSLRDDGTYVYRGRNDLMLNRGGVKISLERIEEAIRTHVRQETVCVSVPNERLGEELGILVAKGNSMYSKTQIYAFLRTEFGQSFDPTFFAEVDQLPLNESFKVDRIRGTQILVAR
jgi:fatty acid CoA ligase FadD36